MLAPTHIVSILTDDRRGIIQSVVTALSQVDGRHLELSQTVVHHAFTIALVVNLPENQSDADLRKALHQELGNDCAISIIPYRKPVPEARKTDRYVLTAIGPVQPGIIRTITALLLERGGNITDLSSKVVDDRLQLLAEVDLPAEIELEQLQIDLRHSSDNPDLAIRLQHLRLFLATNEIAYRRHHAQ